MATFMENLWNSIFTPGPTPTLLLATNASFGALQVVLFALLLMTHSIHFVILSIICGGLWCAINWFAAEVAASRKEEEQEEEERKQVDKDNDKAGSDNDDNVAGTPNVDVPVSVSVSTDKSHTEPQPAAVTSSREADGARPRLVSPPSSGNISADSDWERVEELEN